MVTTERKAAVDLEGNVDQPFISLTSTSTLGKCGKRVFGVSFVGSALNYLC